MGLKLAVVGGGSTYTPELVDRFTRRTDRIAIDEIALLDIDREQLAIVGGPLSPSQYDLVSRVKADERLVVRAAISGDHDLAGAALATNPLVGDPAHYDELFEAILEANGRWLPAFVPQQ